MDFIFLLIILTFIYWLTPIILIIVGLVRLRTLPEKGKNLIIIGVTMLLVGAGFCGLLTI